MILYPPGECTRLFALIQAGRDEAEAAQSDEAHFQALCHLRSDQLKSVVDLLEAGKTPEQWREAVCKTGIGGGPLGRAVIAAIAPKAADYQVRTTSHLHQVFNSFAIYRTGDEDREPLLRVIFSDDIPVVDLPWKPFNIEEAFRSAARIAFVWGKRTAAERMLLEVCNIYESYPPFAEAIAKERLLQTRERHLFISS